MSEEKTKRLMRYLELTGADYEQVHALQLRLVDQRRKRELTEDTLLLVEHQPVFTMGRRGGNGSLLVSAEFLKQRGVPVVEIERGGDMTYHGPGQLVGYPIVSLKESGWKVVDFVEALEEVMLRTAADFGVAANRDERNRGVWVGNNKIGSVGIAIRGGVSYHGFALNVNLALEPFGWIHPCGLVGVGVTTLVRETGKKIDMTDARASARKHISDVLGVELCGNVPAKWDGWGEWEE
jgi:lipoyl(octanoyl) transferase